MLGQKKRGKLISGANKYQSRPVDVYKVVEGKNKGCYTVKKKKKITVVDIALEKQVYLKWFQSSIGTILFV